MKDSLKARRILSSTEAQIEKIKEELSFQRPGTIICCHGSTGVKWYWNNQGTKKYLPKKERAIAQQLARKKYLSSRLFELQKEKNALESYLKEHEKICYHSEQMRYEIPGYRELLSKYPNIINQETLEWFGQPFTQNKRYPEQLKHETDAGHFVRSKSEARIDNFLFANHIPYHYEEELILSGFSIYPDFTISHPPTGRKYYYEHFGMIDSAEYQEKFKNKISLYLENHIYPGEQLLMTFETQNHPLTLEEIERTLEILL